MAARFSITNGKQDSGGQIKRSGCIPTALKLTLVLFLGLWCFSVSYATGNNKKSCSEYRIEGGVFRDDVLK